MNFRRMGAILLRPCKTGVVVWLADSMDSPSAAARYTTDLDLSRYWHPDNNDFSTYLFLNDFCSLAKLLSTDQENKCLT